MAATIVAGLVPVSAFAAENPVIGEIEGWAIEAYCSFMPAGHEFVYDDENSWRFVYMTDISRDTRAVMLIDGKMRDLWLNRKFVRSDFELRQYSTEDGAYEVKVYMVPVDGGIEHTNYTGAVHVITDSGASAVAFEGDCGV